MAKYYTKVHVQYKDGSKARGVRVVLSISGMLSGGVTKTHYTDNYGTAIVGHESRASAKVIVNGVTRTTIQAPGETVVFI